MNPFLGVITVTSSENVFWFSIFSSMLILKPLKFPLVTLVIILPRLVDLLSSNILSRIFKASTIAANSGSIAAEITGPLALTTMGACPANSSSAKVKMGKVACCADLFFGILPVSLLPISPASSGCSPGNDLNILFFGRACMNINKSTAKKIRTIDNEIQIIAGCADFLNHFIGALAGSNSLAGLAVISKSEAWLFPNPCLPFVALVGINLVWLGSIATAIGRS